MENAKSAADVLHDTFIKTLDPRSEEWLLCRSPLVPVAVIASYLYFVKRCGPRFMASRPAYDLKDVMILYNVLQIITNAYICVAGFLVWIWELKSITCQPVDHEQNEATEFMANLVHTYYVLKIADLIDTVFFVLRKKESQATFLHVYHHCSMVVAGYIASRYLLNGHIFLLGPLNALVHTVLYSYYLLCAIWPATREATWKKYITILQLVQFCILLVHNAIPILMPDCGVQKVWCMILVAQNVFMFSMFYDFYQRTYSENKKLA